MPMGQAAGTSASSRTAVFKPRRVKRILNSGNPYVFYIHPWEIDAGQPRITGLKRSHAFRHYVNLSRGESRFASLLDDFEWTTMQGLLDWWRDRQAA